MAAETVGTEAAKPRVRAPQQGRSRETYERIIRTTRALMDGRDYETISVNEICEASDVSHSSFYARFENKEALILHVHEAHRAERMQRLSRYVTDVDWDALSLQGIARACLALYIEDRRALEPFLRSLMLAELRYTHAAEERAEVDRRGIDLIFRISNAQIAIKATSIPICEQTSASPQWPRYRCFFHFSGGKAGP